MTLKVSELKMQKKKLRNGEETCMKEVIATAQDIKYARFLAGNNKVIRDRAIKSLKKWFEQRVKSSIAFSEADLMLVWKGLFYSMWMSDKPLIQEECAERIVSLIHSLNTQSGLLFFKTGLKTLSNEWFGIDQWRADKFVMFVRRLLRQALVLLKNNNWELKLIKNLEQVLLETLLNNDKATPLSLVMHFSDMYMPELAKVSEGQLNPNILNAFLAPFVWCLAKSSDLRLMNAIAENIFGYLMRQSNAGLEYDEKFNVWKQMGFPGRNLNTLQRAKEEDGSDDDEEKGSEEDEDNEEDEESAEDEDDEVFDDDDEELTALDPRAGRVDVILPQINFSCKNLMKLMTEYKFKAANTKGRGVLNRLIQQFGDLSKGEFPLGITKVELCKADGYSSGIKQAANRLINFENKIYGRNKIDLKRKISESECDGDQEVPTMKKQKVDKVTTDKKQMKNEIAVTGKQQKQKNVLNGEEKSEHVGKKMEKEQNLEVQLRKTMETTRKLQLEKRQLVQRNLLLKSKKRKLEREVSSTKNEFRQVLQNNVSEIFVRNSGTWFVHLPETDREFETESPPRKNANQSPIKSPKIPHTPLKMIKSSNSSPKIKIPKSTESPSSPLKSSKSVKTSTPTKNSSQTPKSLFPTSGWDAELLDGEVEIIPSKKYLKKRQSVSGGMSLVEKSHSMLKGKGRDKRRSLGSSLVGDPLAVNTSNGNKKVKIDLRLNKSQEVYEHHAQIKSSPGIPFDANRKPVRPVIKRTAASSPINPFYKRRSGLKF